MEHVHDSLFVRPRSICNISSRIIMIPDISYFFENMRLDNFFTTSSFSCLAYYIQIIFVCSGDIGNQHSLLLCYQRDQTC